MTIPPSSSAALQNHPAVLRPALFLHIQKTAGTSIQEMARQYYGNEAVCSHDDFRELGLAGCAELPFVSGHFGIAFAKPLMANRYSFTFLREPRRRLISLYTFYRSWNGEPELHNFALQSTLEEFLLIGRGEITAPYHWRALIWNNQTWQLAAGRDMDRDRPSDLSPSEMLHEAQSNLSLFQYVGRVESWERDTRNIFQSLGATEIEFRKVNKSPSESVVPSRSEELLLDEMTVLDRPLYEGQLPR
jgi:hypothetical protein